MINETQLNLMYDHLFEAGVQLYVPVEYLQLDGGFTVVPNNLDESEKIWASHSPIAGIVRSANSSFYEREKAPTESTFVLRTVVPYSMAMRCVDTNIGTLILSGVINSLVGAAYKKYGDSIASMTFKKKGKVQPVYLRELENHAGFDITLTGVFK